MRPTGKKCVQGYQGKTFTGFCGQQQASSFHTLSGIPLNRGKGN